MVVTLSILAKGFWWLRWFGLALLVAALIPAKATAASVDEDACRGIQAGSRFQWRT